MVFLLRFSPIVVIVVALALPAQKGAAGGGAGASTGKPASPPRVPANTTPSYSTGNPIYIPGSPYNYPVSSESVPDPMLERLRRQERQKQVKRDTDRLVRLTSEYQAELKSTGPTTATDKHLKEIEKLAHNVRTTLTQ